MGQEQIKKVAKESLDAFEIISESAKSRLELGATTGGDAFVSMNTFTGGGAIDRLGTISSRIQGGYKALLREPAISRVIAVDEDGKEELVYISRGAPVPLGNGRKLASYSAPLGRLASLSIGDEATINIDGRKRVFELLEKVTYKPTSTPDGWDSRDSVFQSDEYDVATVESLRALLRDVTPVDDPESALEALLAGQEDASVLKGIQHEVRTAMALRDQPILDKIQDEIFRLPLNSQLLILGPPGTGKTTTLIRRLGQKIDPTYLESAEKAIVEKIGTATVPHEQSWVMFTPTELLKHYLKEAFNREQVPASDHRIKTWIKHRNDLARNVFGILQSSTNAGKFVVRESMPYLGTEVIESPQVWVDEFAAFHQTRVFDQLRAGIKILLPLAKGPNEELLIRLSEVVEGADSKSILKLIFKLERMVDHISPILKARKAESDRMIQKELRRTFNANQEFLSELASFLDQLRDEDDTETDDEFDNDVVEETTSQATKSQRAAQVYTGTIRTLARSRFLKRSVPKGSKTQLVKDWLDGRVPADDVLLKIGRNIALQNGLRRFVTASRRYVSDVPSSYKEFRKVSAKTERWYAGLPDSQKHISAIELDAVVLLILRNGRGLLSNPNIAKSVNQPRFGFLKAISDCFYNQVLVDEATDFSPVQLACMESLSRPETNSFFACGDFNQRITTWGTRSPEQIKWVNDQMETRSINIVYRQSRKLNKFSVNLLKLLGGELDTRGELPECSSHEGVDPVLIENCSNIDDASEWLVDRIKEVEHSVGMGAMPTIAVLVDTEVSVEPMANSLNILLEDISLTAVPCKDGQALGEGTDVRVFDAKHIKGLEFEAVFFVGVDALAEGLGELFGKYLYVGATRAATYFGVICNKSLPNILEPLREQFTIEWG